MPQRGAVAVRAGAAKNSRRNNAGKDGSMAMRRITLALAALALAIGGAQAAGPEPTPTTPELVAAARKEGAVVWYGSEDLQLVTAVAKAFEAKYPGISATAERSGAERNFQRISQEYASNIHVVDVVTSSNPGPILYWKRNGLLA